MSVQEELEELENSLPLTKTQLRKLKREERKKRNKERSQSPNKNTPLSLRSILPLTNNQEYTFNHYRANKNLMLHGMPGTGKTFIALYLALDEILNQGLEQTVYIVRSAVSTRDIGFLPGKQDEKTSVYELPYKAICSELFGRPDAYDQLKARGVVHFMSTSFIRGLTLSDCIVIVDESQNLDEMELHSIITRLGDNAKIIFCGDTRQDDLTSKRYHEESGLKDFMKIIKRMKEFAFVEFNIDDIVRSGLVKSYIIQKYAT